MHVELPSARKRSRTFNSQSRPPCGINGLVTWVFLSQAELPLILAPKPREWQMPPCRDSGVLHDVMESPMFHR
jgi:hypothetical protein